jgi:hypothetical protein
MGLLGRAWSVWNRFWFRSATAENLAICRILLVGSILLLRWNEDYRFVCEMASTWKPSLLTGFLFPGGVPGEAFIGGLQLAWKLSLVTALVGLFTRASLWLGIISGSVVMNLYFAVTRMPHEAAPVVLCLAVLGLSRCGDAYSMDSLFRAGGTFRGRGAVGPDYRWPVMLCRLVISVVLCNAGLNKLRNGGLEWVFSDNLTQLLAGRPGTYGTFLSQWPLFCSVLAGSVIAVEVLHPLSLFSRRAAMVLVPAGVLMIAGFWVFMGIPFFLIILLHIFWIPWVGIVDRVRNRKAGGYKCVDVAHDL